MKGFIWLADILWDAVSSLAIHGLLIGTVVLALLLLGRYVLRALPRRAAVWLWLPLLLLVFSPILPGYGITLPRTDEAYTTVTQETLVSDGIVPGLAADPSTAVLPEADNVQMIPSASGGEFGRAAVWQSIAVLVWFGGMLCVLGGQLYRHGRVRQLCRLAGETERRGRIRICTLPGIRTPFVYGVFRPTVLMPEDAPADTYETVLLHEQTHVRRLDPLWRLLWEAALCVYWFQPLLWFARDAFIADTEGACDEAVLLSLHADRACRAEYARTLLVYSGQNTRGYPPAFGMAEMQARVHAVLYPAAIHTAGIIGLVVAVLLTAAVALLSPAGDDVDMSAESAAGASDREDGESEPETAISDGKNESYTAVIRVEPTSALFGFIDGYVEARPEIWTTTDLSFTLPAGWSVEPQTAMTGQLLDAAGTTCGTYVITGFSPIDAPDIPPENIPPDDRKWQAIYTDLRLSMMQNVADADYHPVVTEERFESAVAVMDQAIYEEGVPAAAWEHQRLQLVLAYDQDCSMYVRMTFDAMQDTAIAEAIAASVRFDRIE